MQSYMILTEYQVGHDFSRCGNAGTTKQGHILFIYLLRSILKIRENCHVSTQKYYKKWVKQSHVSSWKIMLQLKYMTT